MFICRVTRKARDEVKKFEVKADTLNDIISILFESNSLIDEQVLEIHIYREVAP